LFFVHVGHGALVVLRGSRLAFGWSVRTADDALRGPALPDDALPDGEPWRPRTLAWWATWRQSAQAREFLATDWDLLLDTALIHHAMWTWHRWEFAIELKLRDT
jgi:hypothetical protein